MAAMAETCKLVANKTFDYRFSKSVFSHLKYFKRLIDKTVSSKWRVYFNRACLNEHLVPKYCKYIYK